MTSAQVVETSVANNSSFQNYSHPDDLTTYELLIPLGSNHLKFYFHNLVTSKAERAGLVSFSFNSCSNSSLIIYYQPHAGFENFSFSQGLLTRLVSPWVFWLDCVSPKYEPWLDQTRLICRRSVPKWYN